MAITPNVVVSQPSQLFTLARSFKANANGKIYIGEIDSDPTIPSNQIQVYLENEDGSHVPVAQPIVINAGGFPVYNGQIAKFVTVQGHSMAIYDAYNVQQFYFPNVLKYDPDQLRAALADPIDGQNASLIAFDINNNYAPNTVGYELKLATMRLQNLYGVTISPWQPGSISSGIMLYSDGTLWSGDGIMGSAPSYADGFFRIRSFDSPKELHLSQFGVVDGDDVTAAFNRAIVYAKAHGYLPICVDVSGSVTGALEQLNNSFNFVAVRGESGNSTRNTILDFIGAPDGAINYIGGSGALGGVGWRDIEINAGTDKSPLLVKGFTGLVFKNVRLRAKVAANLSNDIATGTFTEFFQFDACDIYCDQLLHLKKGAGNDSFHGCGYKNGTVINKIAGSTLPLIGVGSAGDTGRIALYNGYMDGTIFWEGSNQYIISIDSSIIGNNGNIVTFSGNMRVENFSGADIFIGNNGRVVFGGITQSLGGGLSRGLAHLMSSVDYGVAAAPLGIITPEIYSLTKAAGSSSATITIEYMPDGVTAFLRLIASNYEYDYLLAMLSSRGSLAASLSTLATMRSFNSSGGGAPTLTFTDNTLTISSANATWIAAEIAITLTTSSRVSNLVAVM
ncbi:phage head-binding domain-containing protein [Pectobacterium brasiliense]|uniref:phage head-binding domain-containing protein n=1 Tax=Pectobacterium brasiliense TaxID=180957 RepID=UPI000D4DEBB6|nr:phage head-binding domain-containing protein [Pectobacterium brasiliense]PPE57081.1 hypothetical protein F152LOC_04128 [Pectobacterium brasiliense]